MCVCQEHENIVESAAGESPANVEKPAARKKDPSLKQQHKPKLKPAAQRPHAGHVVKEGKGHTKGKLSLVGKSGHSSAGTSASAVNKDIGVGEVTDKAMQASPHSEATMKKVPPSLSRQQSAL